MSRPASYPLAIYRGDCEHWTFRFYTDSAATLPWDLTGSTAKAEVRYKPGGSLITTLATTVVLPNEVNVTLDDAVSGLLDPARGSWDLQITDAAGCVTTVVVGPATITGDVTDSVVP